MTRNNYVDLSLKFRIRFPLMANNSVYISRVSFVNGATSMFKGMKLKDKRKEQIRDACEHKARGTPPTDIH